MPARLEAIVGALFSAFRSRANLVAENLVLRQQLAVLRVGRRPRLGSIDRAFWVVVSRSWSRWIDVLAIVKPATVIAWHRRGYATAIVPAKMQSDEGRPRSATLRRSGPWKDLRWGR